MIVRLLLALAAAASAGPPSVIDRIAGPDGRYDYVSVDPALGRVFIGRGDGVMAVDLATRSVIPVLAPGEGVAAVLLLPDGARLLATNGDVGTAMLVDRRSGRIEATIAAGKDPDGAAYDAGSGLAFVMNGESEDVTVIDPRRRAAVATIGVGGKPEAAVADGRGHLFVNIEDKTETIRIDIATRRVTARYRLAGCEEPTGLAHDRATGLLIAACHNGVAKLIDASSGADRGGFAIGRMADGAIFDPVRRRISIPCNDGTLWITALDRRGRPTPIATITTQAGARTAALDPASGRLYLPAADTRTTADGKRERVPGTFKLLVVGHGDGAR